MDLTQIPGRIQHMSDEFESGFLAHGEPAWHGMGVVLQDPPDSEAALIAAGLDWSVIQRPILTTPDDLGDLIEVPQFVANLRASDNSILGVVSDQYRVVQNREAFNFMDSLVGEDERTVHYETAGSLRSGKVIWLLACLDENRKILGDEVRPYLLFTNSHDGSHAVRVLQCTTRVVCMNTLNMALRETSGAYRTFAIRHTGDVQAKVAEARRVVGLTTTYLDSLMKQAESLAAIKLGERQEEVAIERLFPVTPESTPRIEARVLDERMQFERCLKVDNLADFQHTGWGFVNAAADYADHKEPSRWTQTWKEIRFEQVVNGHPLLDRAVDLMYAAN